MSNQKPKRLTRRQSLELATGILALGAGLGVTKNAEGAPAGMLQLKIYMGGPSAEPKVVQTVELAGEVAEAVSNGRGGLVQLKWFRSRSDRGHELVARSMLPETLRQKKR